MLVAMICGKLGMWRTRSVLAKNVEEHEWLMIEVLELWHVGV
jgi:hypothetical protein